jgi:hypothetical protein
MERSEIRAQSLRSLAEIHHGFVDIARQSAGSA